MADDRPLLPDHWTAPYGSPEALENVGTAAAPLLAGFAFTLIGLVIGSTESLWRANLSLLVLVCAGLLMIAAVQFAFNARGFHVPADQYLAFLEIAEKEGFGEEAVRGLQIEWRDEHGTWATRTRRAYNLGIVLLLAGVSTILIPHQGPSHMPALRTLAVLAPALGALIECVWGFALPWLNRGGRGKDLPTGPDEPATPTPA